MAAMAETNGTGRFLGEFEFGFKREVIDVHGLILS